MKLPKLRLDVQIIPFTHQNEKGYILKDTLSEERVLFLSAGAALLIPFLDGRHTTEDIQKVLELRTGQKVLLQDIQQLVQLLDENFFLDTPAYHNFVDELYREYKNGPARPSLLAGNGYPAGKNELKDHLAAIFKDVAPVPEVELPEQLHGAVVPHIDIERGKNNYAQIYTLLKNYPPADTYVILGVNHHYLTTNPFIFTNKPYLTPLGKMEIDMELLNQLQNNLGWDIFEGELAHKGEHSVEFPALFLSYIYPDSDSKILPVLCNFHEKDDPRIDAFIYGLRYYMENYPGRIVLIASVDFSHIGPQFGWEREVDETDVQSVREADLKTLKLMASGDADAFYYNIIDDGNKRHIDALGAGFVFLKVLGGKSGQLIRYDQAFDPLNTVTFAGLLF